MKKVLLVVQMDTHFVELSRLARLLSASGKYKPVLWFHYHYATMKMDVDICRSERWEYILPPISTNASSSTSKGKLSKHIFIQAIPEKLRVWFQFIREFHSL